MMAASFLTSPVEEVVLRDGSVVEVENLIRVERGRLIFEAAGGVLYSVRLSDVDVEATDARLPANRRSAEVEPREDDLTEAEGRPGLPRRLPVSDEEKERILRLMEARSHTGRARPRTEEVQIEPDLEIPVEGESDEWQWRLASRSFDDAVERAKDDLRAARQTERELNDLLLFYAGSSGDASNYSYLVYQLADVRSLIPRLEADVARAEEARRRFLDDARRQSIPPGWLR